MLNHGLLTTSSILAITVASMFPGMSPALVGGDLPNCNVVKLDSVACNQIYSECSGNINWCAGCGEGKAIGLCAQSPVATSPCTGSVQCMLLRNSIVGIANQSGQVCVTQDCPKKK